MPADSAGPGELHRAVDAVAVGEREGVHAVLDGPLDQHVRVRGAVAQRVAGGHVQVDEGVAERGMRVARIRGSVSGGTGGLATARRWTAISWPGRPAGEVRDHRLVGQAEGGLDQGEEGLRVAQQVVGLARGDRPGQAGLGRGPLAGAGGEERRPLGELGRDLRQQRPHVARPLGGRRPGAHREHRRGRAQRRRGGPRRSARSRPWWPSPRPGRGGRCRAGRGRRPPPAAGAAGRQRLGAGARAGCR